MAATKTEAYTVALADRGTFSPHTSVGGFSVELPADASVACPVNFEFGGFQGGAGQIVFAAGAGAAVIYQKNGGDDETTTRELGSAFACKKIAVDTWYVCGAMVVP